MRKTNYQTARIVAPLFRNTYGFPSADLAVANALGDRFGRLFFSDCR
ncbi:MAG TPA: hypothetical protein V6D12_12730 [Candidatus Obscuribacterales bacterium]